MHLRTASCFLACSMALLVSGALWNSVIAAPASQPMADAGEPALLLAPPAAAPDEATVKSLADGMWELQGPMNILGAGGVETLQFARSPDGVLQVTHTYHRNPGVNARDKVIPDRTETSRCNVAGVVLAYGQERQSFVVLKNDALVLNALVPLGKGKWYYTSRLPGNPGQPGAQEEYLFDFGDDPCQLDNGDATLQIRQNNFPAKGFRVRFALTSAGAGCRYFDVLNDDGNNRLTGIGVRTDGAYGLMLDNPGLNTKVFKAVASNGTKPATRSAEPKGRE
jgi:hypothetical protein